ncbi:antirestriction protein [Xenorhabdus nematophila]|uniref:antirestriction protein n=1 Tax=Xenorhabdus nematophila TaxID=628 RepID=UPI0032B7A3F6
MQKDDLIMLDSPALSAAFPGKQTLERVFLGFLMAHTAAQLCGEYREAYWVRQDTPGQLTYLVPTSAATYSVYLPDYGLRVTLSADAFGLAVTTAVYARLAALDDPDKEASRYDELREYARQHPEAALIHAVLALDAKTSDKVLSPALVRSANNHNNHNPH